MYVALLSENLLCDISPYILDGIQNSKLSWLLSFVKIIVFKKNSMHTSYNISSQSSAWKAFFSKLLPEYTAAEPILLVWYFSADPYCLKFYI